MPTATTARTRPACILQDKFQIRPNLSVTAGLRFDYHGGLTEKNGRIFNFDPSHYSYDATTDTITSNGFIIAGNNPDFPTKGVSDSTLTGRQWGLAPRIGLAWSPKKFNDKVVVRAGWGLYYDRGELFTYLSPGFASGVIAGGPFGVNQTPPWVNSTGLQHLRVYATAATSQSRGAPTLGPPPSGNPADLVLPNAAAFHIGLPLFSFADYNRANKLPYTMNQTLDIQWQPRNDLVIEIGYVGNLGRHEVVPIPFNQAQIASPTHPIRPRHSVSSRTTPTATRSSRDPSYTLTPSDPAQLDSPTCKPSKAATSTCAFPTSAIPPSRSPIPRPASPPTTRCRRTWKSDMSHGLQVGFSYTYSHATDEQSAMGLFYNGNNPLDLRSGYGLSDFDRKHVINFTYRYELPKFFSGSSLKGKIADGWAISGLTVIQSGQPYSVVDYSGAVGSIFYGVNDGITNPDRSALRLHAEAGAHRGFGSGQHSRARRPVVSACRC